MGTFLIKRVGALNQECPFFQPFCTPMRRPAGYSLIELLVVAGLLAMIAAAAIPALTTDDEYELDSAAREVADAIRYAHAEAIRRGIPYGVSASVFSDKIELYWLDESGSSPTPVYDVRHPQTKQLYSIDFGADANGPDVTAAYFKYQGLSFPQGFVGFSAITGVPKYAGFISIYVLETGYITLSRDGLTRTISVSPVTGRVTIQ